jgi:hypothetical protein
LNCFALEVVAFIERAAAMVLAQQAGLAQTLPPAHWWRTATWSGEHLAGEVLPVRVLHFTIFPTHKPRSE